MLRSTSRLLCVLTLFCGSTVTQAASPGLGSVTPRGFQRGTDATMFFNGGRLSDAKELLFYSPGFAVAGLQVVNDGQVKATVKIAPDCRLGEHAVRVRTATGLSEMRTFWIGALPTVDEKEPNSDFAAPQKIPLNVTVHGVVDNEDVDYYAVEVKKGQRLSAEIEGMRLGNTLFDPYLAILDSKRFELAASDDSPHLGQDCCVSIVAPADGTYIVQVRESAYGGNGACQYRLHVGTFPRPLAVVPAGGKPGEELEVTFLGDPTGPIKQKVKVPATAEQKFSLVCQDEFGISPSGIPFRLSPLPNTIEVSAAPMAAPTATAAVSSPAPVANAPGSPTITKISALPAAVNGVISKAAEVDEYHFTAKKGQTFDVHCYARRLGSPLDSVMLISLKGGGGIVSNDDAIGPDSYFRFAAPQDGEYVLTVWDHLKKGGPTYFYRIEFTEPAYSTTVSIPKVALYSQERQPIPVPRGNRYATMVTVSRGAWGGEAVLGGTLPAGITLNADVMAPNLDTIPVVFQAAPSAAVAGGLVDLTATPVDPNLKGKIPSKGYQVAEMIVGPPGQSIYWRHEVDRFAVAVTDEVPFKINIVEPKVPVVQNGSMNLKIVAERQAGYKAPITVFPLINIPGVSAASSATIPENGTETTLVVNAAPGAQARKWKIAVIANAGVATGPVWVSSQLATLEVATPLIAFTMERAAVEQGKSTDVFCKIQQLTPFAGTAKVKILGLPPKVATTDLQFTKDSKEIAFKLDVDKTSPPGTHRNIFCQVVVEMNGEPILHNTGGTELRIDVPIPPKVAPPPPMPMPMPVVAKPPEPAKPPEKRLTRLEKLRLEQEEREKAAKAGTPGPMPPKK